MYKCQAKTQNSQNPKDCYEMDFKVMLAEDALRRVQHILEMEGASEQVLGSLVIEREEPECTQSGGVAHARLSGTSVVGHSGGLFLDRLNDWADTPVDYYDRQRSSIPAQVLVLGSVGGGDI